MNQITLTAANPGIYTTTAIDIPGGYVILAGLGVALFAIGMVFMEDSWFVGVTGVVAGIAMALVGAGNVNGAVSEHGEAATASKTAYTEAVVDWLLDEYGVKTSDAVANELVGGRSYAADYDGKPITISIIETVDGDIAVVDERRTPLTPLTQQPTGLGTS